MINDNSVLINILSLTTLLLAQFPNDKFNIEIRKLILIELGKVLITIDRVDVY